MPSVVSARNGLDRSLCEADLPVRSTLLPTAKFDIVSGQNRARAIRALCDTGAQVNLIASNLVKTAQFRTKKFSTELCGAGKQSVEIDRRTVADVVRSDGRTVLRNVPFLVVDFLNNMLLPLKAFPIPYELPEIIRNDMADAEFYKPANLDVILGATAMSRIWKSGFIPGGFGATAQNTELGWILFGPEPPSIDHPHVLLCQSCDEELPVLMRRLLRFDEFDELDIRTQEQDLCEKIFMEKHTYDPSEQRYTVEIPLSGDWRKIGSTREVSMRRFIQLEHRLAKDPDLKRKYHEFMSEYMQKGFMIPASPPAKEETCVYIPHHCVQKKFRVVFDASCGSTTGVSLNQVQLIGERLQEDLTSILMRFRSHRFAVSMDIKKMYNCVKIREDQWNLQRVFWRFDPTEPMQEYWLTVVTFGMASAPYCAVRAMIQCARDHATVSPEAARAIEEDFYMDEKRKVQEECKSTTESKAESVHIIIDQQRKVRPQQRLMVQVLTAGDSFQEFVNRTSNLTRLQRVMVRVFRMVARWKARIQRKVPSIPPPPLPSSTDAFTQEELNKALDFWIHRELHVHFEKEMTLLERNREVPTQSTVRSLSPFVDGNGLLRVGGRLCNADIAYGERHPILLPEIGPIAKYIMRYTHLQTMHGGPGLMNAVLRQRYWIIGGRRLARK